MTDPARTPKTGYISNGLPVEVLARFVVEGETKYYVREFYDGDTSDFYNPDDEEPWGAEYVVSHIYEAVETTPTGLRYSKLQAEVEALEAKKRAEAEEARQAALDEKRDPGFNPQFSVGETVYAVDHSGTVAKTRIKSITFTKHLEDYTNRVSARHEYAIDREYARNYNDDAAAKYLFRAEEDAMICAAPIRDEARRQSRAESLRRLERTRREVAELEAGLQSHTGTDET